MLPDTRTHGKTTEKTVDKTGISHYNDGNFIETVEAEITAMMPAQRARSAENRVRNKSSNGPLRAQSKGRPEYSATRGMR